MTPSRELTAAIVGLGYWGPNLLRNFTTSTKWNVGWIVDTDERRRSGLARLYPNARATADLDVVLGDAAVDLVAIATPPVLHFPMASRAIAAGKHVLVEKPLAEDAGHARALVEAAERAGVRLFTDHTFLYAGAVEAMRRSLTGGELGEIYYAESTRVNLGLFQQTHVIWDLAPHDLSILNHVFGELPHSVACHAMAYIHPPVWDVAFLLLRYGSGRIAQVHLSWLSPVKVRRMMLSASTRMVVWDDVDPSEKLRVYDKGVVRNPTSETLSQQMVSYRLGDVRMPIVDGREPLAKMADDLYDSISGGAPSRIGGAVGYDVVRCIEAACKSAELNGAWVNVEP
ncbi:MAG TPA: Gfo/Idh/MocA family oxidoreductase [Candidatus Tumulicola sp.]|nr:Gfo/Idh/MocA family oxidoreductase [Candidatus Tumulicola sp.]